ncbi:barstar family protein [Agathobaculum sp.]|uniref:barstar family protein n=1 Tax=Agathobaculum sp. TaxID=2048138 RepID=UPI002A83F118|nr:barstar family protein [Agathobaculum sp.]MDY3619285.1 barstar family protein [Agathobaculum sp.]
MRELLLDAETLYTRGQLHDAFARALALRDDEYGRNLDALYDTLTACPPTRLTLRHAEMLVVNLGNYGELALRVLADAAAENPQFVLQTE